MRILERGKRQLVLPVSAQGEVCQNKVCTSANRYLGQLDKLMTVCGVNLHQPLIFFDSLDISMPTFRVRAEYFGPGRGDENRRVIRTGRRQPGFYRLGVCSGKSAGRIYHPPVEEDPARPAPCQMKVLSRHGKRAPGEGSKVNPRQGFALARQLLLHDPAPRLWNRGVAPACKLIQQCGFTASGAPGDDDAAAQLRGCSANARHPQRASSPS